MYTRKRLRLRGGSVPYLDGEELGIHSGKDLRDKMELYTIGAHGETTDDNRFIIVPPNTYFMFTAHSGTTAEGNDPGESTYVSYTNAENKDAFYDQLYTQLFKTYEERKATGLPIYPEELYIYEPGDLMPDYTLSFNNTIIFMFRHGLYKLPVEALSGKGKRQYTYIGRILSFIKKLLDEGKLTEDDLKELKKEDRDILKLSDEEIEKEGKIPFTKDFKKTRLYQKIEKLCCRGEDNLLIKPPFNVKNFYKNKHVIRLSTILTKMPYEGKESRFFFMNFCRISYKNVVSGYSKSNIEVPKLLRTLSFSGKCSLPDREAAFNLIKVRDIFCGFHPKIKQFMLRDEPVRNLIAIMKKSIYPEKDDFTFWKNCLGNTYRTLNAGQRYEMIHNYEGYLTVENIRQLINFYHFSMTANRKAYAMMKRAEELNKPKDRGFFEALKNAYAKIGLPFKTLNKQFVLQSEKLDKNYDEKIQLIKKIYNKISDILSPVPTPTTNDYLKLIASDLKELEIFDKTLDTEFTQENLIDIKETLLRTNGTKDDAEDMLISYFILFTGRGPISKIIEDFGVPVITDNSIEFNDLENSNVNNVVNVTERLNKLGIGGRRKTRKNRRSK